MPHVTSTGVSLYYEEHGAGSSILCVHGTSSSALVWGSAVETLAGLGRVIAYDRRGCTRSERPDPYEITSVAEHTDDAVGLLRALDAEPAVVIGRSYGGSVAIDLALRYPRSVRAVALLEAVPYGLSPEVDAWGAELTAMLDGVARDSGVDAVAEALYRDVLGEWEGLPAAFREMASANGQAILAEQRGGELTVSREELTRIGCPVLVVSAEESPDALDAVQIVLAESIPDARLVRVGGGHLISATEPAVLEFVSAVLSA